MDLGPVPLRKLIFLSGMGLNILSCICLWFGTGHWMNWPPVVNKHHTRCAVLLISSLSVWWVTHPFAVSWSNKQVLKVRLNSGKRYLWLRCDGSWWLLQWSCHFPDCLLSFHFSIDMKHAFRIREKYDLYVKYCTTVHCYMYWSIDWLEMKGVAGLFPPLLPWKGSTR